MKKMMVLMITVVFTLTLGLAYAGEELQNGVTDFTGRSYDTFEIGPADAVGSVESISAGGLREKASADKPVHEAIDTGRISETLPMNPALGW